MLNTGSSGIKQQMNNKKENLTWIPYVKVPEKQKTIEYR